jgi:hypothetical protein
VRNLLQKTSNPSYIWHKIVQKITRALDCPDFIAAHRQQPQDFTRQRHLTFKKVVLFLLNQPKAALQTELDQFYQALQGAPFESQVVSALAFSKTRSILKPHVFETLNQALQQQLDSPGLRQTWQGLRLLAIDGSSMHLPLEPAMTSFFGSHCDLPVARLSTLHDVGDGQSLHSLIVTPSVGERDCAHLHLEHTPANSLILFDRGYPAHWLFALLKQQRQHFVMRLPAGYNPQVKQFLQSGLAQQSLCCTAAHWHARLFCAEAGLDPDDQVRLRLIRVELPSGETEILATSLLDQQAFPVELFADLYHRRWGIETDYRRLKQTLSLDNFSGRTVHAVQQDFHASQLLKNLALLMQRLQQPAIEERCKNRKLRWQANFTQGVSRLKNTLITLLLRPCEQGLLRLLKLMGNSLSAVRPGRSFPRQRKRPATQGCEGYKPARYRQNRPPLPP